MEALYFTLENQLRLMVIPDTLAHLDGHPVITRTYSIFCDRGTDQALLARSKESSLHLDQNKDPDYYGFLTFELPGTLFTYTADGEKRLSGEEANELIEQLSTIRDNPSQWKLGNN